MRIAPGPAAVAEIVDFMNDIVGNDQVADHRGNRQINGSDEKIDGVTDDLETVFVDNLVPGPAQNSVDEVTIIVTTIEDFRRNMLFLFLRKPLESGL